MLGPDSWVTCVAVLACMIATLLFTAGPAEAEKRRLTVLSQIERYQQETWRWQRLMDRPRSVAAHSARRSPDRAYRRWVLDLWKKRAARARKLANNPPYLEAWRCIHRYEAAWNDPNPPYYGGLQMDITFQRHYGPELLRRKGTADKWTPLEQIWVAVRAHRSGRGFYPWPNTARMCGLI